MIAQCLPFCRHFGHKSNLLNFIATIKWQKETAKKIKIANLHVNDKKWSQMVDSSLSHERGGCGGVKFFFCSTYIDVCGVARAGLFLRWTKPASIYSYTKLTLFILESVFLVARATLAFVSLRRCSGCSRISLMEPAICIPACRKWSWKRNIWLKMNGYVGVSGCGRGVLHGEANRPQKTHIYTV